MTVVNIRILTAVWLVIVVRGGESRHWYYVLTHMTVKTVKP